MNENCLITQGYEIDGCVKDNTGGLAKIYIANFKDITGVTYGGSYTGSTFNQEMVTDIDFISGGTFYTIDLTKQTSSVTESLTVSVENGTLSYSPVITLVINKMQTETRNLLKMMATGLLMGIVQDQNEKLWLLGVKNGLDVTATENTSGVALGDRNGYTITITGIEPKPMVELYSKIYDTEAPFEVVNGQILLNSVAISSY